MDQNPMMLQNVHAKKNATVDGVLTTAKHASTVMIPETALKNATKTAWPDVLIAFFAILTKILAWMNVTLDGAKITA